uniref:Protein virilizer n=1 Tax=Aceria tosichella TaxID=561515 RepID=A0A6G1SEV5_9ACAR
MQSSSFPFITPSSTCMPEDLLFFDTFSHSNSEKDNFDLVQFPSPVIIDLIKIVPLGQPIEANIPGNVRLGATNPSKCELEFFINDLNKQDAHTMTDLGKFHCSDKDTDFTPPLQIQTDGLLLRGSYRTLTLAIFGQIVVFDEKAEDDQAILSAASPPAQTPASPVASERDIPYIVRSMDRELLRQARDEDNSLEESILKSNEYNQEEPTLASDDITEDATMDLVHEGHVKPGTIGDELSNSGGDPMTPASINNTRDKKLEDIDYSCSSDLDNSVKRQDRSVELPNKQHPTENCKSSEGEKRPETDDCLVDFDAQEWFFNIETYTPKPLTYFPDPSLTLQERTLQANRLMNDTQSFVENVEKEVKKVKEMFELLGCSDDAKTEDWVTLVEDLTNDIGNMSLSHTVSSDDMLRFLVKQILYGLDMTSALSQKQTGFKVRHLKAGIKLATVLFHCGPLAVSILLEAGVMQKVLQLYNEEQMSLPLRLLIFKSVSAACDTVEGVEHMVEHQYCFSDGATLIERVRTGQNDSEGTSNNIESEKLAGQKSLTCYQYMILLLLLKPVTRVKIAIGNLVKKIRLYRNLSKLSSLSPVKNDPNDAEDSVFERDQSDSLEDKARLETCLQIVQDIVLLTKDGCVNIAQPVRYLPAKLQFHTKPSPADSYLAVFKWIKHFRIIESLDFLLISTQTGVLDTEQSIKLRGACLALIQQLLDSPRGAQLLLSSACCEQTANLIRNLAQKIDPIKRKSHLGLDNLLDASLCREESLSIATCRDLSLKLAYCFKVLSCIDKLFDFHRELISERTGESKFICDPEKVLHQLLIMSNHPYGLTAIMKHFSCIGNLDCILRFLDMPEYQKHLEFVRETSIDYVLELVGAFFRLNNNVLEIAEEYLDTLVDLCKIKDKTMSNRIKSLLPWLTPFDTEQPFPLITYSDETFRQLTRVIRKSIPDCSIPFAQGLDFHLPPQLITAVRILRQLCISPQVETFVESNFDIFSCQRLFLAAEARGPTSLPFVDSLPRTQNPNHSSNLNFHGINQYSDSNDPSDDSLVDRVGQLSNLSKLYQPYDESICGDLKYHYGIMQVFEQEGLKRLLNTLRELTGNYPRPIYQSAALSGLRGRIVISYIHSVIMLLHSITCHLIDARGKEFRDTSIISVVLETYSLLSFVPKPENDKLVELSKSEDLSALQKSITLKNDNYQLAQQAKKLILSILMSYTQICLSVSESEENVISKSMWAKMLKEVIDFTLSAPVFFHHGLDVLTRILPAPLPNSSILDTIDQEQLFKNINHRKLWSAHLHPLHQRLELMISNMSLCYQSNIRNLLLYLCNQLCDLSSNTACMVAKTVTDTLVSSAAKLTVDSSSDSHSNDQSGSNSQQQSRLESEDRVAGSSHIIITGTKESTFAVKMVVNLLSSLITNQAFESALTNHLQVLGKKDEKLLSNLYNIIKSHDDSNKSNENPSIDGGNGASSNSTAVTNLIEAIRTAADCGQTKSNLTYSNPISNVTPPEELTKINLIEMARRTSDRFNLTTGITKTYRLKVLMDFNSRAHRSSESSSSSKRFDRSSSSNHPELLVPPSHKSSYVPPIRGRQRPSMRPDSFRSRPQNTSRPPSIHVDDFNDMYGGEGAGQNSGPHGRYGRKEDFRASPAARYQELAHGRVSSPMSGPSHGRHHYHNSHGMNQPSQSSSSYGNRSQHSQRSKYMKMK